MNTKYMKSFCWKCGKEIFSDGKQGLEIMIKKWGNELKPPEKTRIFCIKCFVEHIDSLVY